MKEEVDSTVVEGGVMNGATYDSTRREIIFVSD